MPIERDHVDWKQNMTSASWSERRLAIRDFHDLFNAIDEGPSRAGRVTFDMAWRSTSDKIELDDADHGFSLEYRRARSTISWQGQTSGAGSFTSDPSTHESVFALLGRERNGSRR